MKKLHLKRYQLKDLKYYRRWNRNQRVLGTGLTYQDSDSWEWDSPLCKHLPYIVESIS